MVELREHQKLALDQLRTGAILQGGVGSGKSITALAYYYKYELGGSINPISKPKHTKTLCIITTAKKRDGLEWDAELARFSLSTNEEVSIGGNKVIIDSWNNIGKYADLENAFFIFDEQRLVGYGAWSHSFIKITKKNKWVLLTATPGDTWIDYLSVFIANGFYKNKTEFIIRHVTYTRFAKYPKIDHYRNTEELIAHRDSIVVPMSYEHPIHIHKEDLLSSYDEKQMEVITKKRWNIFENKPIKNAGELAFTQRKLVNSDSSRLELVKDIYKKHQKLIVFYNFNYELYALREFLEANRISYREWNGHHHNQLPETNKWIYLVQYTAGAEGWNCIATNAMLFYSQNYSYKILVQAQGRINRLNTPFEDLYYYYIKSNSFIDQMISKALNNKKNFNEREYELLEIFGSIA
jgi:hypothetical protein